MHTFPREIGNKAFYFELAQQEQARDNALAIPQDDNAPTEIYIQEDVSPPSSNNDEQPSQKPRVHNVWISDDDGNNEYR